jgi:hypothetical protein
MTEAIFGLAGVVIGGLLNGGVSLMVEHRREKREARTAARLLEGEVAEIRAMWDIAKKTSWAGEPLTDFEKPVWLEWRAVLATSAPHAVWHATCGVYAMQDAVASAVKAEDSRELSAPLLDLLTKAEHTCSFALQGLGRMSVGARRRPRLPALRRRRSGGAVRTSVRS